jgi:hypothetical protein
VRDALQCLRLRWADAEIGGGALVRAQRARVAVRQALEEDTGVEIGAPFAFRTYWSGKSVTSELKVGFDTWEAEWTTES